MLAIHQLDRSKGLDLFLHTPGGNIAATESIIYYLRSMFGHDIRAVIPQCAFSAGTMIACSCKEIIMGKNSNLGPIDPQMGSIPAQGVLEEFERACKEIKLDPHKINVWQYILRQYKPTFLSQCENAVEWAKEIVEKELENVMFKGARNKKKKALKIVETLSFYSDNKSHQRHFHIDECRKMGLKIIPLEEKGNEELQDKILTVHHCYMHTLMNTPAYKIIENQNGVAIVKNEQAKR